MKLRAKRPSDLLLIAVFTAMIATGLAGTFGRDLMPAFQENRALARAPTVSDLESVEALPAVITNFFADNFGLRKILLARLFRFKILVLKADLTLDAVIGKDGWMFFRGEVRDHRREKPLEPAERDAIKAKLDLWCAYARDHGAALTLLLAPNKSTIYPDKMPDYLTRYQAPSRLDQVYGLDFTCPVIKVDPRTRLRRIRNQGLYYKWGTHWNESGALVAWEALRAAVVQARGDLSWRWDTPEISQQPAAPNEDSVWRWYGSDDPEQTMLPRVTFSPPATADTRTAAATPVRLLAVGDSFLQFSYRLASGFVGAYAATTLETMNAAPDLAGKAAWFIMRGAPIPIATAMERFHPNVLMLEVVERHLDHLIEMAPPPGYLQLDRVTSPFWENGIGTDPKVPGAMLVGLPGDERADIGDRVVFAGSGPRTVINVTKLNPTHYIILVDGPLDGKIDGFPHFVKRRARHAGPPSLKD
jgi:hypothetical protein